MFPKLFGKKLFFFEFIHAILVLHSKADSSSTLGVNTVSRLLLSCLLVYDLKTLAACGTVFMFLFSMSFNRCVIVLFCAEPATFIIRMSVSEHTVHVKTDP